MLESLRKNTSGWFLKGLLLLCMIAMGMFGVDQLNNPSTRGGEAAAYVNGDTITQYEYQQALSSRMLQFQQMLGDQFNESLLANLRIPEQTLDGLIQMRLLAQKAENMDMLVPDSELSAYIKSIPQLQTKDGKFDIEAYRRIPNRGLIEKQERTRLQVSKLQTYMEDRVRITPAELRRNFLLQNTKAKIKFAEIDFAAIAAKYKPSKKDLAKLIQSTPEEEFQKAYDANKEKFTLKARVKLRQIRAGIPFQAADDVKLAARKTIDDISSRVNPTNFAEVAKKESDDEYAKKGGDVGWVDRGSLDPALEAAIDSLAPGQVSGPIETNFGYFILLVDNKKEQALRPLAEVKEEIAQDMAVEKRKTELEQNYKTQWEAKLAAGKSIENDLKKIGVETKTTRQFAMTDGRVPQIGSSPEVLDAVFSLTKQKPYGSKLYSFRNRFYFIELAEITPANMKEFPDQYLSVEQRLKGSLSSQLITQWLDGLKAEAIIEKKIDFGTPEQSVIN